MTVGRMLLMIVGKALRNEELDGATPSSGSPNFRELYY